MPEEQQTQQSTETTKTAEQVLGNDQTARNSDGSLKDNQAAQTTTSQAESTTKADTTAKVEPEKKVDAKADTKTETKAAAPTYTDFKAPEGVTLDKAAIEAAIPIFQKLNLTQEQAQELVTAQAAREAAIRGEGPQAYEDMRADWRKTVINDPALGDGKADLKPEVKAVIGRAVDSLPPAVAKDFREALILTGAGDNPAFVKAFYTLASQLGEGTLVRGGGPSPMGQRDPKAPVSAAAALFPNLPSASR